MSKATSATQNNSATFSSRSTTSLEYERRLTKFYAFLTGPVKGQPHTATNALYFTKEEYILGIALEYQQQYEYRDGLSTSLFLNPTYNPNFAYSY